MRVGVTGLSGWVGHAFSIAARQRGWTLVPIVRRPTPGGILWDARTHFAQPEDLEGLDAVVHLAGESIFGLWTSQKRQRIRDSRVDSTALLARALAACRRPPATLVSVSAVGYYGNTGDDWVDASHQPGHTFLAGVCRDWEAAAEPAREAGIRVTHPRFGVIMDSDGGVLQPLIALTRWGLGAVLGDGEQWISWISRADVAEALCWSIETPSLTGAWNCVSPEPVRQGELARALAKTLHRPCWLKLPASILRMVADGLAEDLLLCSCRARPDDRLLRELPWSFRQIHPLLRMA
jgi:uncharacterized protein (TIGR01777 family)